MNEQKPRWGKGAVVLIAAAVVFLLAGGAFGTLWILERNDHSATTEQLTGSRTQAEAARTKLKEADDKRKAIADKLQDAVTKERTQVVTNDRYRPCADASRVFANAVRAQDSNALEKSIPDLTLFCV
jgi:hypothetical protein